MNIEEVEEPETTRITTKNEHLRSWRAANYENYHEKWTSKKLKSRKPRELQQKINIEEVEAPKQQKSTSFIWKPRYKDHPRPTKSTRITTKNENRRSWRAEEVRELPRETRFRPFQDHRRPPKSTRIATKNEHPRSWRAGNYENSHAKPVDAPIRHPKSTRITTKNTHASTKPRK